MEPRFAMVTGTSSGIGACLARALAREGWRVLGVARRGAPFEHEAYTHVHADLGDVEACRRLEEPLREALGSRRWDRVGLVNNAAQLQPVASLAATAIAELARSLVLNIAVPAWLMGLLASRAGDARLRIVNISSGAATSPYPGWGAYCAGKAGLRMAGQVMAVEADEVPLFKGRDIAVVSYAPGVMDTPMQDEVRASPPEHFPRIQKFLDLKASGALVDPEKPAAEIAKILARDDLPRFSEMRYGG